MIRIMTASISYKNGIGYFFHRGFTMVTSIISRAPFWPVDQPVPLLTLCTFWSDYKFTHLTFRKTSFLPNVDRRGMRGRQVYLPLLSVIIALRLLPRESGAFLIQAFLKRFLLVLISLKGLLTHQNRPFIFYQYVTLQVLTSSYFILTFSGAVQLFLSPLFH